MNNAKDDNKTPTVNPVNQQMNAMFRQAYRPNGQATQGGKAAADSPAMEAWIRDETLGARERKVSDIFARFLSTHEAQKAIEAKARELAALDKASDDRVMQR